MKIDAGRLCVYLQVPRDVCELRFSASDYETAHPIGTTSRDEMLIAKYDSRGRIVAIELLGDGKACQQWVAPAETILN